MTPDTTNETPAPDAALLEFAAVSEAEGYGRPAIGLHGDAFIYQRDQDRYEGWLLARRLAASAPAESDDAVRVVLAELTDAGELKEWSVREALKAAGLLTPSAPPAGAVEDDRLRKVTKFALHRFMNDAYARASEAAQKTSNKPASVAEAFLRDAKDAERALAALATPAARQGGEVECCVPTAGEPKFVLLGRDPQAPALIEAWAADRERAEPDSDKPAKARDIARRMRQWKAEHPDMGLLATPAARQGGEATPRDVLECDVFAAVANALHKRKCNDAMIHAVAREVAAALSARPAAACDYEGELALDDDGQLKCPKCGAGVILECQAARPAAGDGEARPRRWIKHDGNGMPVSESTIVEYRRRSMTGTFADYAYGLRWDHAGEPSDIIEYRIVSAPPAREGVPEGLVLVPESLVRKLRAAGRARTLGARTAYMLEALEIVAAAPAAGEGSKDA